MTEEKTYKTNYEELFFYWLGGYWGYAIIKIRDDKGVVKIRLSKCKKKKEFPSTDKLEWWNVDPQHIKNLSQVNHINFKSKEEFESCYSKIIEEFEKINSKTSEN